LCGIGTNNPAYKLDIISAANALKSARFYLGSNTASAATIHSQLLDTRTSGSDRGAGYFQTIVSPVGNSGASYYGIYGQTSAYGIETDNINSMYGCRFTAQHSGTGNVNTMIGLNAYPYVNSNGGTVLNARGFYLYPWMGNGTIINWTGIHIGDDNIGSGSMTNVIGIYMEEIDGGTSGNYAIYSKGGDVYFEGDLGLGTSAPAGILDIAGAYHFPRIDGSNGEVLKTDGSGELSWSSDNGATEIDDLTDGRTISSSVFLGTGAGANDDGNDRKNVGLGNNALNLTLMGSQNTAIGHVALQSNTSGSFNTALGALSLMSSTSGVNNTAIGYQALTRNTTGDHNTATGCGALDRNTTGEGNTANGVNSLYFTTGSNNSAYGYQSLYYNVLGYHNTAIGYSGQNRATTGNYNTSVGGYANYYNETGSKNTIVGYEAGKGTALHSKSGNVFLGYQAGYYDTTDNKLYIDNSDTTKPLIYGDFSIDSASINGELNVTGTIQSGSSIIIDGNNDKITATGGTINFEDENLTTTGNVEVGGFKLTASPIDNYILASDASGNGSWTEPASIGLAKEIDDLTDGKRKGNSIYLGSGAGFNDNGANNYNTAVGDSTLFNNTTGNNNTANGYYSLYSNTDGDYNAAYGSYSLFKNTTGLYNTACGSRALKVNTTGNNNTAIGRYALYGNIANSFSTAVGYAAMYYADNRTTGRTTFNTAVGCSALHGSPPAANNTGRYNTAVGANALSSNSTGDYNTANGSNALYSNTSGDYNTANGSNALYSNTTGDLNTANGRYALYYNTTGNANTANGYSALYFNTTGDYNTANGHKALFNNRGNSSSTAVGYEAMYYADTRTTGRETYNTAIGCEALKGCSNPPDNTGRYNTAVGHHALFSNTSGYSNTAIGNNALYSNTTGYSNTANGGRALYNNTTGDYNTAHGRNTLESNTTGNNNTAIGYSAMSAPTSYDNSTAIGYDAEPSGSNQVRLGNDNVTTLFCTGAYEGIVSGGRELYAISSGKIGYHSSSMRYKDNIADMNNTAWLYDLRPVNFTYKKDEQKSKQYGLIAEEVEQVNADFVSYNDEGVVETVNYSQLISPMLKALQEQQKMIEELKAEIEELKNSK